LLVDTAIKWIINAQTPKETNKEKHTYKHPHMLIHAAYTHAVTKTKY